MSRGTWFVLAFLAGSAIVACGGSNSSNNISGMDASTPDGGGGVDASVSDATADSFVAPEAAEEAATEAGFDASGVDGGPPNVSPTSLDFGLVNCGSTASTQTFTIDNPSASSVTWSATLGNGAGSAFVVSPASGTLSPGQSVQVTVTPNAVPANTSTSSNALGDVVTVALNNSSATVTLSETAQGAILGFVPTTLAFGSVPLSSNPPTSFFAVQNTGNASADVTLTLAGDPAFTLPSGVTTQSILAGGGSTVDSSITYAPTAATTASGTVTMTLASDAGMVLCAPLPAALTLSGTGTNGQVAVSPTTLVFGTGGLVPCGTNAQPQTITLQNTGSASFTWSGTLTHGSSFYTLTPASGSVAANTSATVTVTPKAIPATSATTAGGYDDTLTITTNVVGDSPHTISLQETAQGAIVTRSTNSLGFGSVGEGSTVSDTITFANTGNVDATLDFANGTTYFVQPASLTVGAGTFASESVSFSPTQITSYADIGTVALDTQVPLCGALPGNLSLSGTGAAPSVTATPSSLNFGLVACGATGSSLTVTITNNEAATTFNTQFVHSYFTVSPTSGSLTAGGTAQLSVTPNPIPMPGSTANNGYGDTLTVTTGLGTSVNVALNQTALGAVLAFSPAKITFTTEATPGTLESSPLTVTNSGTGAADVTLTATLTEIGDAGAGDAGAGPFGVSPASDSIGAGGNYAFSATFLPEVAGAYTGAISISVPPGTNLCAALPANVTLSGTAN